MNSRVNYNQYDISLLKTRYHKKIFSNNLAKVVCLDFLMRSSIIRRTETGH